MTFDDHRLRLKIPNTNKRRTETAASSPAVLAEFQMAWQYYFPIIFQGECMHSSYGLQTCLHGYRPYARLNHLPLLYSPMEYRLLLKPSTKNKPQKFEFSMKFPEPDAKSKTWVATVSVNPSTKITVTVKYDYSKGTARLEVLPSRKELTKFPKFCLGISLLPDNVNIAASFARNCVFKNLKVC